MASEKTALATNINVTKRKLNLGIKNQKPKFKLQKTKGLKFKPLEPSHEALGITSSAKTSVKELSEK